MRLDSRFSLGLIRPLADSRFGNDGRLEVSDSGGLLMYCREGMPLAQPKGRNPGWWQWVCGSKDWIPVFTGMTSETQYSFDS